jgi:MFS family permease
MTAVLGPPISQASDYWGRRWFIVVTLVFGIVGSVIIARATSMGMVIVGQVISSVFYGSQPLWYAVTSEILPRKSRAAAQGGFNASLAIGAIYALLLGAVLIKDYHEGFRIFWYINTGLLTVSAVITGFLYIPPPRPLQVSLKLKDKLGQLDWVGYVLLTTGITLFSIAGSLHYLRFTLDRSRILQDPSQERRYVSPQTI